MSAMCECGHPYNNHHGDGPCLVALGRSGKPLPQEAKGSVKENSVCPCSTFRPAP